MENDNIPNPPIKVVCENLNDKEQDFKSKKTIANQIVFTRKNRKLVFAVLLIICTCVNFDNGIVPSASKEIKELLNIDDQIFGLYGSLSFFGCLLGKIYFYFLILNLGSFVMLPILQMKNRKIVMIIYTIINLISIFGLIIENNFLNFLCRLINGFTNVN
jgi:hypothetical protein